MYTRNTLMFCSAYLMIAVGTNVMVALVSDEVHCLVMACTGVLFAG